MPKAMLISTMNVDKVAEIADWNLEGDKSLDGCWYVEGVQFPHGFVEQAIVTPQTFDATFKIPEGEGDPEQAPIFVDYK